MNEEKIKNILLILFITAILGGTIWGIISITYSPIKTLRDNKVKESSSYINVADNENASDDKENESTNILGDIDITIDQNAENINIQNAQKEVEIATYTTTIYDTEESRIHNITLAIDKLDGAIVEKGQEFSFNDTIGPMGKEQGYEEATGFNGNGKKIKIYGGGICQISSTLYNSALIAGLEITERHAHSRRVYYVPQDKDASVLYGGANLKFINNRENDIKISASTDGHEVTVKLIEIE